MDRIISADHLPERDRFDFWRDEISKQHLQYDLQRVDRDTPFRAELRGAVLGEVIFSASRLSGVRGHRSAKHIATDSLDHYVLGIPVKLSIIEQDDIEYALCGNEMVLFDGTRPLRYRHGDDQGGIMIAIPRHLLYDRLKHVDVVGPRVAPLDRGVGLMVGAFCQALPEVMKSCPTADVRYGLAEQLISLIALAFRPSDEGMDQAKPTLGRLRFQAMKDFIRTNLHDPDLSPDHIARAMGVSRSYLYKLFAQNGFGFREYIRGRRLAQVAVDLRNPSLKEQSITYIAMCCGFSNMSHFSRCFAERYGESPRSYRARMLESSN